MLPLVRNLGKMNYPVVKESEPASHAAANHYIGDMSVDDRAIRFVYWTRFSLTRHSEMQGPSYRPHDPTLDIRSPETIRRAANADVSREQSDQSC
jgi:hypothetical protein